MYHGREVLVVYAVYLLGVDSWDQMIIHVGSGEKQTCVTDGSSCSEHGKPFAAQ